tara:strand:- start:15885 stop:15992 length:108 start_codon:yes stop_codon:yes gene_type:complete
LHQIADAPRRLAMMREFSRVISNSMIITAWVDGNW